MVFKDGEPYQFKLMSDKLMDTIIDYQQLIF